MNVVWLEASGWGAFHRSNPGGNQEPLLHLTTGMELWGRRLQLPSDVQLFCFHLELNYCSMFISSVQTTMLFQGHKKFACNIPSLQFIFRPLDVVRSLTGPSNSPYDWKNGKTLTCLLSLSNCCVNSSPRITQNCRKELNISEILWSQLWQTYCIFTKIMLSHAWR